MKKLTLLLLFLIAISFNSCKKEENSIEPTQPTITTPPPPPKVYTYNKAYIYEVKFFALSSSYKYDDIRFVVKKGAATLFQSKADIQFLNNLPFSIKDYAYGGYNGYDPSPYINSLNVQHTLYLQKNYSYNTNYSTFVYWNFTPTDYIPAPSTAHQKDTTISQSLPDNSVIFDVTFRFNGE